MVIDFLYKALPSVVSEYADSAIDSLGEQCCVCCERLVKDTISQKGTLHNVYSKDEVHCLSCQILFHPSQASFGIESYRGRDVVYARPSDSSAIKHELSQHKYTKAFKKSLSGKFKLATERSDELSKEMILNAGSLMEAKLGMLPGCFIAVSETQSVMYAPGKYFDKLSAAPNSPFKIIQCGEFDMLQDVRERFKHDVPLLIIALSKKKADQIQNLALTTSINKLMICSDSGISCIHTKSLIAFEKWWSKNEPTVKKSELKKMLFTLRYFFMGNTTYDKVVELLPKFEGINQWIATFPNDPHEKISIVKLAEKML
jgi:hypothetical protein